MEQLDSYEKLFVSAAFGLQIVLLVYFALRKWKFDTAMRVGWIVYALAVPALLVSILLLRGGSDWPFWLAGFLYTAWAVFGYIVDFALPVSWRAPVYMPVLVPYVLLYLAAQMFYWWPLATIHRPLWFIYAALFAASSILNLTSHAK